MLEVYRFQYVLAISGRSGTIEVVRLDQTLANALADAFSAKGWNKPREQYARYLEQQEDGQTLCLVAKVDGAVAGYVKVVWASSYPPLRESAIPEIQDLNVLDEFRRRGVASRLLDHAEAEISKRSAFVGIGVGLTLAITQPRGCMSCAGMCPMLWV